MFLIIMIKHKLLLYFFFVSAESGTDGWSQYNTELHVQVN